MRINKLLLTITLFASHQLFAQVPTINSFAPASGPVGTSVNITGTNFSSTAANNTVFFGAVRATINIASANSLTVLVPSGATFQPMTVTVNGLTAFSAKPFLVTFAGGGLGFSASSFESKIDFPSGQGPSCVASGDLDGDGKPDLISVNDTSNTVAVFRNVSTASGISFSPKIDFNTGSKPLSIVVGDIDGDGKQDMVAVNAGSNTISLFRNTTANAGNITFSPRVDLQTGSIPYSVSIRDLNGDGKLDLAVVNNISNSVSVFKNNSTAGSFSFSLKTDFTTGSSPSWIDAGDLDNDGKPDLAIANGILTGSVSVLRNTSTSGNISFASKIDFDGGNYAFGIFVNDIDGDNKLDVTVANGNGPATSILLNSSSGSGNISFLSKYNLYAGSNSYSTVINDLDGDGKPDIAVASSASNLVSVLKNNSNPGYLNFPQTINLTVGSKPWVAIAVDLDGDAKSEIITANHNSANISVLKNVVSDLLIQSFSPVSAGPGITVTILGANFKDITGVSFGGVPASSFIVNSSNSISAIVSASSSSGNIKVSSTSGTASLAGFIFVPAPKISSFAPTVAGTGDTVLITGTNLTTTTAVSFGRIQVSFFKVDSSTSIKTVIGEGASGNVLITTTGGMDSSAGFTYNNLPSITSFSPNDAATGDTVTIIGKHFNGTNLVSFGSVAASSFIVNSIFKISAVVGAGATGDVVVKNLTGIANIGGYTYIPPPSVSSFTPTSGGRLTAVTIIGNNFNGTKSVTFGDIPATSFSVNSNTSITAIIAGGSSGSIKVATSGGTSSLAGFIYISLPVPVINSFSPMAGPINTNVIIHGNNFSSNIFDNVVYFGGIRATVLTATTTSLKVKVPVGATFQAITVTVNNLTAYSSKFFNVTFGSEKTDFTSSSFANKINLTTTNTTSSEVGVADLDGDGRLDIVSANYGDALISIFKNIGDSGTIVFSDKSDYALSGRPGKIYIGDLDGDAKPDVAVTNQSNFVSIFRNVSSNGMISFAAKIDISTGDTPEGITMGDIDADGKTDLVITNLHDNTVSIFRNRGATGTILFDQQIDYPTGLSPYYVCVNDFDGDSKPDIAVANYYSASVSVFKNKTSNGIISFENKADFIVGSQPYTLSLGDIDGDGKIDIAASNAQSSSISILKNIGGAGTISFENKIDFVTGLVPYGLCVTDIDGDGLVDFASGNSSDNSVSILRNNSAVGTLSFVPKVDLPNGNGPYSIAAGDFDRDGKPDLVTANFGSNTISIYKNKIGETVEEKCCPPLADKVISSNIYGASFQWQVNTGAGFINISNNSNYLNSNTSTLALNNIPSSWNGYQYRCVVDGNNSDVYKLSFINYWTGFSNTDWNNAENWLCNTVPDINTDVTINSGTIVINSNVTVRSLKINPGAIVTVNPGFNLVVLH